MANELRTSKPLSDLPEWARNAVLRVRHALVTKDLDEAYHQLYNAFTPVHCYDPWAAMEGRKCACTNHD
jgi:hypothetical protein